MLNPATTGTADSIGSYVLTDSNGSFVLEGDYSCTPGTQVYLYASGGDAGSGSNSASGLLAILGERPIRGDFAAIQYIQVNEVSTIAAAYAFAGFATDATHVSSSGTALAQVGIANAFANATNLAALNTGIALMTTPAGNGDAPQTAINSLANMLDSCVNSESTCDTLLSLATSEWNAERSAAYGHGHRCNQYRAQSRLKYCGNIRPRCGKLGFHSCSRWPEPNDFGLAVEFHGPESEADRFPAPCDIAIDGSGNAWFVNASSSTVTGSCRVWGVILSDSPATLAAV